MNNNVNIHTIAKYLKSERIRLEMSQTQMAALGGISKATQLAYETGVTKPDAVYLSKLRAGGVDTGFILSGIKTAPGINWQLLEEVDELMAEWQRERADPISLKEQFRLRRILYSQFSQNDVIDQEIVDVILCKNERYR